MMRNPETKPQLRMTGGFVHVAVDESKSVRFIEATTVGPFSSAGG